MHNRGRLLTASFLTKTLYVDWRIGAAPLPRPAGRRRRGEQPAQLAVGGRAPAPTPAPTGCSTRSPRPRRFDPHGTYVRRWVPELAGVEGAAVHRPWRLPERTRKRLDYPAPIVDLGDALDRFRRARGLE